MHKRAIPLVCLLLAACAAPNPIMVAPAATGMAGAQVSKLLAASEAKMFPCHFLRVQDSSGARDVGVLSFVPVQEEINPASD